MKEKQKTVYYCDFCKKYRLTRNSMYFHERSCTLNPDRVCRVSRCINGPNIVPRYAKGECPWCKFSKFRLGKDFDGVLNLDMKQAMQDWWAGADPRFDAVDEAAYDAIH